MYSYKSFRHYKQNYYQSELGEDIERKIIQNYINDYPWTLDSIYNDHASIVLIKEDYTWAQAYIKELGERFEGTVVELDEIKKIMKQYVNDGSYRAIDSPPRLNSISADRYKIFIVEDMEFVELVMKFLKKRPASNSFPIEEAISSIKTALITLKKENDVFARKVDFIVEEAKIELT